VLGITQRISAYHSSANLPDNPRLEFLNHPGIRIFRWNWIRCIESLYPGNEKAILWVIAWVAEHKYQFNTCRLQLFQSFFDKSTPDALILVLWVHR